MQNGVTNVGGIPPRRVAGGIGLLVLAGLVILGLAFYKELGNLLVPSYGRPQAAPLAATQDTRVQRGSITQVLRLAGTVEPELRLRLSLQRAQATVVAVSVYPGQLVEAGQLLIELDKPALGRAVAKASEELLSARQALDNLLSDRGLTKRTQLLDQLRQAQSSLDQARLDLESFQAGQGTPAVALEIARLELANAEYDLANLVNSEERQEQLRQLQVTYNEAEVKHGPYVLIENPSEMDRDLELILRNDMLLKGEALAQGRVQYEMDVRAAEQRLVLARRSVRDLELQIAAGSHRAEQLKRESAVTVAVGEVASLQAQLKALEEGLVDPELAKAQSAVVKLEGKLADAELALAEGELVAPFSGMVEDVQAQPGTLVGPGSELLTVFSVSDLRLLARVNEVDIGHLYPGQAARISFDAFAGQSIDGVVGDLPAFGTYQNGLTVFDVLVDFAAGDLELRPRMNALIEIPIFRKEDVLYVPLMAVQYDDEGPFVIVVEGRRSERRYVKVGASDGTNVEIVSGLDVGEVIRILIQGPIQAF